MQTVTKNLTKIGLNDNEAKTYCALLSLGKGTALEVARKSCIPRTTIYDSISTMKEDGLIREIYIKGKKQFMAESPVKLTEILNKKKNIVEDILPSLLSLFQGSQERPKISVLQGAEGIRKGHELSLKYNPLKRTRFLGDIHSLFSYLPKNEIKEYVRKRIRKGIRNQVITTEKVLEMKDMYSYQKNRESLREIRYIKKIKLMSEILFHFGNHICVESSSKEGYTIIIESKEFSETFDSIFDWMWMKAKEVE